MHELPLTILWVNRGDNRAIKRTGVIRSGPAVVVACAWLRTHPGPLHDKSPSKQWAYSQVGPYRGAEAPLTPYGFPSKVVGDIGDRLAVLLPHCLITHHPLAACPWILDTVRMLLLRAWGGGGGG